MPASLKIILKHFFVQNSSDESGSKVTEMARAVEELQKLLKQAGETNIELENVRKDDLARFEEGLKQKGKI